MNQEPSDFNPNQNQSYEIDGSFDSPGDQKQIISQLHNKVSDLLHVKNRNQNLEKKQDIYKKYCDKLKKYKQKNEEFQNKLQLFSDAFQFPLDTDDETIQQIMQNIKTKLLLINSIQNELNLPKIETYQDNSNGILNEIIKLKSVIDENNSLFTKIYIILGIMQNNENRNKSYFESPNHNEIISAIQKIKENMEEFKATNDSYIFQQQELAKILNIELDQNANQTSIHYQIKNAIKKLLNDIQKDLSEFTSMLAPNCDTQIDTPELVKSAISSLQKSVYKSQKESKESQEKLEERDRQLQSIQQKNEKLFKKLNCSTLEEIGENMNDLMDLMGVSNPDVLRGSIRQMKDKNKDLYSQIGTLNSKYQMLQIENQTLNEQLGQTRDQLNDCENKFRRSVSKKKSLKNEVNELKSKLSSSRKDLINISNERNDLKGQVADKEDEILTLKALLQTEKGNIKVHFDEMNNQILTIKTKLRKSEQDNNELKSDLEASQIANKSLEEQRESLKADKINLQKEIDQNKEKVRSLNKVIAEKSDELDSIKATLDGVNQVNINNDACINELENEKIQLKHQVVDLNNKFALDQQQISKLKSQIEQKSCENQLLRQKNDENQSKLSELESQLFEKSNELEILTDAKQELLTKNGDQQKILSKNQSKISELEDSIKIQKQEINEKQTEITQLKSKIDEYTLEIDKLNENQEEIKNTVQNKEKQIKTQQSKIIELDQNLKQHKQEINKLNSQISDQISQLDNLTQQNENLSQSISDYQAQVSSQKVKIGSQEENIKQQKLEIENKKNQINELETDITEKQNEIQQLTENNNNLQNKNNELQKQIQQHKSKILESEQSIKSLNESIENMSTQINECHSEKQILESNISLLKSENESQRKLNIEIKQTNSNLLRENQKQAFEMQQQANKYEDEIASNRHENETLKQLNESIKAQLAKSNANLKELTSLKNSVQEKLNKLEMINKNIQSKLNISNADEIENKTDELLQENSENKQKIDRLVQNENSYCTILGIQSNSDSQAILNSISSILSQNQELGSKIKTFYVQMGSIASQLDMNQDAEFTSIQNEISCRIQKLAKIESENQSMMNELNDFKAERQKLQEMLGVHDQVSAFHSLSQYLTILNDIKSILNVQDNEIVECIQNLKANIQQLSGALNVNSGKSLMQSVSLLTDSIQDAYTKINIKEPSQIGPAIQTLINEKENYLQNLRKIASLVQVDSFDNINDAVSSMVEQLNELMKKIYFYKSVEDKLCTLYGIPQSKEGSEIYTQIEEIVNTGKHNMTKYKQQINVLRKQNDKINLSKDDLVHKLNEIQNLNLDLNQNLQNTKQQNDSLTKTLNEMNEQNNQMNDTIANLQKKIQELNKMNNDLTQKNNSFEIQSQNNSILQNQLYEICQQLKISSINYQKAIMNEIGSLQKSKEEYSNFRYQIQKSMRIRNAESDSDTIREIENINQLISDLCALFNVKSKEVLFETAQKQMEMVNQISPLSKCFKNQDESNITYDEGTKWQKIVKEAQTMKQINDKIAYLVNAKDPTTMINTIKSMQSQLRGLQMKYESVVQYRNQLCDLLDINIQDSDDNITIYGNIQKSIKNLQEAQIASSSVINSISNLYNCDNKCILDAARMQCKTINSISKILGVSTKSDRLLTIEKMTQCLKKENDSFKEKNTEYRQLIKKYFNDLDISLDETNDVIKSSLIQLKNRNSALKDQCSMLQIAKQDDATLIDELKEKSQEYQSFIKQIIGKFQLNALYQKGTDINSETFNEILDQIDKLHNIQSQHRILVRNNKELTEKLQNIETNVVKNMKQFGQSNTQIVTIENAIQSMKSFALQINKLRELFNKTNSPFSCIVNKIIEMNDMFKSEISLNEKLNQEIKINNDRICEYQQNEEEFKRLIQVQENKIDSLANEIEQNQISIRHLNNSLADIYKSLDPEHVTSTDFAINAIEDLKRQIVQNEHEISEMKSAATLDDVFQKMLANEKQTIKDIRQKLYEQTQYFNSVISKLIAQIGSQNQNQEEIRRILNDAEADNYRLLDLLDPPLNNVTKNSRIHIGNEYSMNPFMKQNADIFRKKIQDENTSENCLYDTRTINSKIRASQKELTSQMKKIEKIEGKASAMTSSHPNSSMINSSLRKLKEPTTLF